MKPSLGEERLERLERHVAALQEKVRVLEETSVKKPMTFTTTSGRRVVRAPDCCGCFSFPYELCAPCRLYNERTR